MRLARRVVSPHFRAAVTDTFRHLKHDRTASRG